MRRLQLVGLIAVIVAFAVPREGSAQVAERIRRERMERERLERYLDRYDRYDRDDRGRRGPPFCRNGRGHPVHGRRWCVEKGFGGRGRGYTWDDYRWERARWGDVVILDPRYDSRRYERRDDRYGRSRDGGWLRDVVGDILYGRLTSHSRSLGWSEPLRGEWFRDDRLRVLSVYAGERPVAELIDLDGDGRIEDVQIIRRR